MDFRNVTELLSRVYIKFEKSYTLPSGYDFNLLLEAVAEYHPNGDGVDLFETDLISGQKTACLRRTRKFLLRKIDRYIYGISQRQADETMASFVSLKQIKNIGYIFSGKRRSIPAYSVIILYQIFCLLPMGCSEKEECKKFLELLYKPVKQYHFYHEDDELARFFEECFDLVKVAMDNGNEGLSITEFPAIPRVHPDDIEDI